MSVDFLYKDVKPCLSPGYVFADSLLAKIHGRERAFMKRNGREGVTSNKPVFAVI